MVGRSEEIHIMEKWGELVEEEYEDGRGVGRDGVVKVGRDCGGKGRDGIVGVRIYTGCSAKVAPPKFF